MGQLRSGLVRRSVAARCNHLVQASAWLAVALLAPVTAGATQTTEPTAGPILIRRTAGPIEIDGRLADSGWSSATRVDAWFETSPADNVAPQVGNVAYLAYDEEFLYAAFELADPAPGRIRAPVADRDNVPRDTDYAGLLIDATGDGKTAQTFFANPRGIQFDAIQSDAGGEDSAPDFFWDAAARVTSDGWVLEMRIPFSSLRYSDPNPDAWGILLHRNYPRDFRYQIYSGPIPRDRSCFVCNVSRLEGLRDLPSGGSLVAAPFLSASRQESPAGDAAGLESQGLDSEVGLDLKWSPSPSTVIDATINPDFSQIESDAAQIGANERFALFFPENRPFFLEGIDLFQTPIQAVYTRSFAAPLWGVRATGTLRKSRYTLLVGQDRGGGSVILPGSQGSSVAVQDFESSVVLARYRRDLGESFLGFLVSDRESEGGGFNRVAGPDVRWRPTDSDTVAGQVLWSTTRTPDRPDLAGQWDGRRLDDVAARLWWYHGTDTVDWFVEARDFGEGFRADSGFVPQVGFRRLFAETGYTFRPEAERSGASLGIHRVRAFVFGGRTEDREGRLLDQWISPGVGLSGRWDSFGRIRLDMDEVRAGAEILARERLFYTFRLSPTRALTAVHLEGFVGDDVDFAHDRPARGGSLSLGATVRPTEQLELRVDADRRWLDVAPEGRPGGRLFTAQVGRLRATYNVSARSYVRLVGQWIDTERDPDLYADPVDARDGSLAGSLLFAYKLNWQTAFFLGYSDHRTRLDGGAFEEQGRALFLKVSYAFQGS